MIKNNINVYDYNKFILYKKNKKHNKNKKIFNILLILKLIL